MDYTEDEFLAMFTDGQAGRMSDAWLALRVGTTRGVSEHARTDPPGHSQSRDLRP